MLCGFNGVSWLLYVLYKNERNCFSWNHRHMEIVLDFEIDTEIYNYTETEN